MNKHTKGMKVQGNGVRMQVEAAGANRVGSVAQDGRKV